MNCRRVQKLIPLHVEGDLRTSVANRVESHLEWCGRCNWLADEYKESQRWLHKAQPPSFDETFLKDLKRGVMKRVAENTARPSLLANLARQWSRRQILAVAAIFVMALGMLALYFYQARVKAHPPVNYRAVNPPPREETKSAAYPKAAEDAPLASSNNRHRARNNRKNFRSLAGVAKQAVESTLVSQTSGTTETANVPPDQTAALTGPANSKRDMLRIEIQTGDPSIRIIWFAPKETDLHQSKPATD